MNFRDTQCKFVTWM